MASWVNSPWRAWNTSWLVLKYKDAGMVGMKSCEVEMLTGWVMGYDMDLPRAPRVGRLDLKWMKYTNLQSAIYMRLMYKWSQNTVGFTIFRGAWLYRARTANTERYLVFCIKVNSFFTYNLYRDNLYFVRYFSF